MGHFGENVCQFINCIRAGFFPIKNPLKSGVVIYSDQFRIWGCVTQCGIKIVCTECDFLSIGGLESVIRGIFKLFHWRSSNLRLTSNSISDSDIMEMFPVSVASSTTSSQRVSRIASFWRTLMRFPPLLRSHDPTVRQIDNLRDPACRLRRDPEMRRIGKFLARLRADFP